MTYQLHITKAAERDVRNATDYIDLILRNPAAADALLNAFGTKANELTEFPLRFALAQDEILASWGIRFTVVQNYLLLYIVDEASATVHIIRFLHAKQHWISILKGGFSVY